MPALGPYGIAVSWERLDGERMCVRFNQRSPSYWLAPGPARKFCEACPISHTFLLSAASSVTLARRCLGTIPDLRRMNDVTRILTAIEQGETQAAAQLLPLVYDELRRLAAQKLAQEKPGHTLEATALVHEAYHRLVGSAKESHWDGRGHFFAAAAEAMRRILVEAARRKQRLRHGGGRLRISGAQDLPGLEKPDRLLALDEALDQLATTKAQAAD